MISTAKELQQLANLPSVPEIETTRTAPRGWEDLDAPPADDREVQICHVDWKQLSKIKEVTEGDSISVWFRGTRRDAWVAESLKPVSQNLNIEEPPPRFPIIICQDGLFSTAVKLQQFANFPMLPEMETTRIVPISCDDADGPPADGIEVQVCGVDVDQRINIDYLTEGETFNVWFKGAKMEAWLARSLRRSQSIDPDFYGRKRTWISKGYFWGEITQTLVTEERNFEWKRTFVVGDGASGNEQTSDTTYGISQKSGFWMLGKEFQCRNWLMDKGSFEADYIKSHGLFAQAHGGGNDD